MELIAQEKTLASIDHFFIAYVYEILYCRAVSV